MLVPLVVPLVVPFPLLVQLVVVPLVRTFLNLPVQLVVVPLLVLPFLNLVVRG